MANIPKIQKALYTHIPKIDPSYPYPFEYLQNIPYPFKFLANIPVSLKTLPEPQLLVNICSCCFAFHFNIHPAIANVKHLEPVVEPYDNNAIKCYSFTKEHTEAMNIVLCSLTVGYGQSESAE